MPEQADKVSPVGSRFDAPILCAWLRRLLRHFYAPAAKDLAFSGGSGKGIS